MRLILASASPRRAELLATAGLEFEVVAPAVDETPRAEEAAEDYVLRVARDKARAGAARAGSGLALLAADTVVVVAGRLLGQPSGGGHAREMLRMLSGTVHEVLTAVVLLAGSRELAEVVRTRVRFVPLSDGEIDWYIATGEPQGKAGGYAIQGQASRFVDHIEGSWANVVGLPVATVYRMLRESGVVSSG